jgi:hypothetical protein
MKNTTLRYGLIGGALVVLYLLVLFFIDKKLIANGLLAYWLPFVIHAVVMWIATGVDYAKNGTERDFRERSRTPFGVFALANILFWICMYGLHLADPDITRHELSIQRQSLQAQAAQPMDPQDRYQLTQTIGSIDRDLASGQRLPEPLNHYLLFLAIWNILGFGLAALITAIRKR